MDRDTWLDIRARHAAGEAIKVIAREEGIARNTVRRALQSDSPPRRGPTPARTPLDDDVANVIQELLSLDPMLTATEMARRIDWPHSMSALRERIRAIRAQSAAAVIGPVETVPRTAGELTSFVGRAQELSQILHAVSRYQLVSLVGPGGVGKSRLAQRAAADAAPKFRDGVHTIEFASLHDPELVIQTLVDGFGILSGEPPEAAPTKALIESLRHRSLLLVLDNAEHLLDALAEVLHSLLREASGLRVIMTSRQPIDIDGEHVVPVLPLASPASTSVGVDDALRSPAVRLFVDRADSSLSGFHLDETNLPDVVELCRRLDGIPLAIELAAVRLRVLSLPQLLSRLVDRFTVLTGGDRAKLVRHRTLQATVAWSHELCTVTERTLWSYSTVFPGSFDLDALDAVCTPGPDLPGGVASADLLDAVSGLTNKSIFTREATQDGNVRFRMLETIREFGRGFLLDVDDRALRARHLNYRLAVNQTLADQWYGPDQARWVRRMKLEQADLRAALTHALGAGGDPHAALQLVGRPWFQWAVSLSMTEHRRWLTLALAAAPAPSPDRATALLTAAMVAMLQGDRPAAAALVDEGRKLANKVGDGLGGAYANHVAAMVATGRDDYTRAAALFDDAEIQYRDHGASPNDLVAALDVNIGLLRFSSGDLAGAHARLSAACVRSQTAEEFWLRSYALSGLGFIALLSNDLDEARKLSRKALTATSPLDDTIGLSLALDLAAWTAAADNRYERSAVLLGGASARWSSFGEQLYGSPDWQARRQSYEEQTRATLGGPIFDAAFQHGATMNAASILSYALTEPPEPIRAAHDYLTDREHEIATQVAQGLTNREIAERLGLSHRTVEGHVSRSLAKLGFSRRAQLAAWMERIGNPVRI